MEYVLLSTDYQNLETAKEFSDKCVETAAKWAPVADRLWSESCAACGKCAKAAGGKTEADVSVSGRKYA